MNTIDIPPAWVLVTFTIYFLSGVLTVPDKGLEVTRFIISAIMSVVVVLYLFSPREVSFKTYAIHLIIAGVITILLTGGIKIHFANNSTYMKEKTTATTTTSADTSSEGGWSISTEGGVVRPYIIQYVDSPEFNNGGHGGGGGAGPHPFQVPRSKVH